MAVLDVDGAAALAYAVGQDLHQTACSVLAAGAPDGDSARAGREHCVLHEVVDELAGGRGVAQPVADVSGVGLPPGHPHSWRDAVIVSELVQRGVEVVEHVQFRRKSLK
ncbi:hypothetical protein HD593_008299 [Nonomuraea rubra]|uniref:Uncharacterized protein n=1 Tax=Nonomuraea rubra TaxID=46180 RepID=A0A7X0P1T4_9ACTN|nr:hypothetical protein [Nonomuraea rubra]MBB6553504.1 hypothetical protein [Nonomuraea rubra]